MFLEFIAGGGAFVLVAVGASLGRMSVSTQQRIVRLRQERHRWQLRAWQDELEREEGTCDRCRSR